MQLNIFQKKVILLPLVSDKVSDLKFNKFKNIKEKFRLEVDTQTTQRLLTSSFFGASIINFMPRKTKLASFFFSE